MLEALEGERGGVEMSGVRYTNLRYTDDIMVVAETTDDLQRMLQKVEEQCERYNLEINKDKTKSLKTGRERERGALNIRLNTGVTEQVEKFKYLGVNIRDGTTGKTVKKRITTEQRTFGRLKQAMEEQHDEDKTET